MKVHYINIFLFAIPLNILVHNQRNHKSPTPHTPKIPRRLCECDLYIHNYDNDPQMKEVMDNFSKQTQQRFHEYDERMKTTRQKCKDKCNKEIKKIILKDKLEKELMDKFSTLHTDIQNDAIPTCICEKSIADKVEKGCLRCAQNLGGIVVPSSGVIGEIAAFAVKAWKTTEIAAATEEAIAKGLAAGKIAGDAAGAAKVVDLVKSTFGLTTLRGNELGSYITAKNYTLFPFINESIYSEFRTTCLPSGSLDKTLCFFGYNRVTSKVEADFAFRSIRVSARSIVTQAEAVADAKAAEVSTETAAAIKAEKTGEIAATYGAWKTTIIASIVAIVVIILIMVIIYLVLRYRRKKKMKKKLQYIKLLEE
ncbi:rifin PIR protein, putative [Plasmodium reichenowi]|uniref:Rifin PIR protein, putative n=1 Tax=Plasmodium reichenowi TaxID=5854 RepID=A0A2P9D1E8_PLARE|nr:rifin PIR protein, putative [Plasmodium reichenowi]